MRKALGHLPEVLACLIVIAIFYRSLPIVIKSIAVYRDGMQMAAYEIEDFVDASEMIIAGKNKNFPAYHQELASFGKGKWVKAGHLFVKTTQVGDWISLKFNIDQSGLYQIHAYLTRSYDYGQIDFYLNGAPIAGGIDLFSTKGLVEATGPIAIGQHQLVSGLNELKIVVVGTNAHSEKPYFQFGFDGIKLNLIQD